MALFKKETEEWELVSDDYLDIEDYSEESLHDKEKPPKKPKKNLLKQSRKKQIIPRKIQLIIFRRTMGTNMKSVINKNMKNYHVFL